MRKFRDFTCTAFHTTELPSETAARLRRKAKLCSSSHTSSSNPGSAAQLRSFNLGTYKTHALGDYASTIRFFGTTDSYTTQIVSYGFTADLRLWLIHLQILGRACTSSHQKVLSEYEQAEPCGADCKTRKATYSS